MEEEFMQWYIQKYWTLCKKRDDGKLDLPIIYSDNPKETEEKHYEERKKYLIMLIWPRRSKRIYKDRWDYKQTWLDYVLGWLWLGYWPIFKSNKEKDETNWNSTTR